MEAIAGHKEAPMADDAAMTDEGCGCCKPEKKSVDDKVQELLARRAAVEERLNRLEPAMAGLRGPNAMAASR